MIHKFCLYCMLPFTDKKGNRNYCSSRCYNLAKIERSKAYQGKLKVDLRDSKIQQNNLICDKLMAKDLQTYQSTYEELDKLGFDFSYFRNVISDELGYAHTLVSFQLRFIDPFKLEIQRI